MVNIFDSEMNTELNGLNELAKFKLFKKIKKLVTKLPAFQAAKVSPVYQAVKNKEKIEKFVKTPEGKAVLGVAAAGAAAMIAGPVGGAAVGSSMSKLLGDSKIAETIGTVSNNPQFKSALNKLRSSGMSDTEIKKIWSKSDTYVNSALPAISDSIVQTLYQQNLNKGLNSDQALKLARTQAQLISTTAVISEQTKAFYIGVSPPRYSVWEPSD